MTASPQKDLSKPELLKIHLTLSSKVWFILSASPFCCGVLGTVLCLTIPFSLQKLLNSSDKYSKPISVLRYFRFFPVTFSVSRTFEMHQTWSSNIYPYFSTEIINNGYKVPRDPSVHNQEWPECNACRFQISAFLTFHRCNAHRSHSCLHTAGLAWLVLVGPSLQSLL